MSRRLILGTAGHIDHGKTALVGALTGIDTDRLKEEKERGITIDLGFAELAEGDVRLGVVDVPGHEGFVRNMLAGATGMDLVLLVVAADEGVMPQTREHLAIVRLLGVPRMVVALTKVDLVEEAWLELVRDEVAELLDPTPYRDASVFATSARSGEGVDALRTALVEAAGADDHGREDDVVHLPVDRSFTVRGTGTVVTGTLRSGRLREGDRVRVLPGEPDPVEARVRGLEVHGGAREEALAGERTAVALSGADVEPETVGRGRAVLTLDGWEPSLMVTARVELLAHTAWTLEHNQRVRAHLGTAEVMARVVLLGEPDVLRAGEEGWIQLRLEAPVVARARERFVLRSYSPVTTIGGGRVVEPFPPKRSGLDPRAVSAWKAVLQGEAYDAVAAVAGLAGWAGARVDLLPVLTGRPPGATETAVEVLAAEGARVVEGRLVDEARVSELRAGLLDRIREFHEAEPLLEGIPLDRLREARPPGAPDEIVDRLVRELAGEGRLRVLGAAVADAGFEPTLSSDQEVVRDALESFYRDAGLAPPPVEEIPDRVLAGEARWPLVRWLEREGALVSLTDGLFIHGPTLREATARVREALGGRTDLGPTDFKELLPVSRRHLLPILHHFDETGVTVRSTEGRAVPRGDGG